jgi:hypothetical protein
VDNNLSSENERNFYVKRKKLLLRQFNAALKFVRNKLVEQFGETKVKEIIPQAQEDFENLLPQIPYVGGKDNPLTDDMINSAILLPLLRIFEKEGLSLKEIGKLTYNLYEIFYKFIPLTDDIFSEEYIKQLKENAKKSKRGKYPDNWVWDFVEGDGKNFNYGVNYFECGVYKFYKSLGAEHFMPLVCIADFAQARTYGYGLKRTQTIGNGASFCDFRYIKDGITPQAWPPDNLTEFKLKL